MATPSMLPWPTALQALLPAAFAGFLAVSFAAPSALAEVGAATGGSAGFPACLDPARGPDEAATPCSAILTFTAGVSADGRARTLAGAGAIIGYDLGRLNAASALVPNARALWALLDDPSIAEVIPNRRLHVMAPPGGCTPWPECKDGGGTGDGGQVTPSGVARVGADLATATGSGIGVAIVDTGLDYAHADLGIDAGDPCFDAFDGSCQDDHGHGTHVGGIVAALDGNNLDVVGVAPAAKLYGVKVLDANGFGSDADIIAGLTWVLETATDPEFAVYPPIRVVNMSLGDEGRDCGSADRTLIVGGTRAPDNPLMRVAIQDLAAAGVAVIVAAGNNRNIEVSTVVPAGCAEVIAVASTSAVTGKNSCKRSSLLIEADTASFFTTDGAFADEQLSGKGIGVTISSPGEKQEDLTCAQVKSVGILSLALGGGTTRKSGTSMASPHVAGIAALMHHDAVLYRRAFELTSRPTRSSSRAKRGDPGGLDGPRCLRRSSRGPGSPRGVAPRDDGGVRPPVKSHFVCSPVLDGVLAPMPEDVRADLRAAAEGPGALPLDGILGNFDDEREGVASAAGL